MALAVAITFVVSTLVAFVLGRWWAVLFPVIGFAAYYLGLNAGWWGAGLGDAWQFVMAILIAAGSVGAVVGVVARVRLMPRAEPRAPSRARG